MPPLFEEPVDGYPGEDTIIVKEEQPWSRPSSPESMSPEIEPLVANLLRQLNTPNEHTRILESPEPEPEDEEQGGHNAPRSHRMARAQRSTQATPPSRPKPTTQPTQEARLLSMPEKRALPVCSYLQICLVAGKHI